MFGKLWTKFTSHDFYLMPSIERTTTYEARLEQVEVFINVF